MPKGLFLWQSEAGKYLKFRGPLKPFGVPSIAAQQDLSATAGYESITADMLPRYLVACGLSVPAENFSVYRLPLELANLYQEISEMVILKPFSHLDDNWDYNAIK